MEEQVQPNQTPEGGAATQQQAQPEGGQPSALKELITKKGFKSEDDVAKSYMEAESSLGKKTNVLNSVKQQLESAGYTMDDSGNITPLNQPQYPQTGHQQYPQGQYPQQGNYQTDETIYDPYTGQPINDPIAMQLARMPLGQREAFLFNSMADQRDKQQGLAYTYEQEILGGEAAKGFESEVRAEMLKLPLAQRADKNNWERALLEAKGRRYDQSVKGAGDVALQNHLNKENVQAVSMGQQTGAGGQVQLTSDEESAYKYYQDQGMVGEGKMFKDRSHFAQRYRNNVA